jgi:hypothetical protein
MYLPTLARIIGKRRYRNDFNFAFKSHTGKYFQEDFKWEVGLVLKIGDIVFFKGDKFIVFDSWEEGMEHLKKNYNN